MPLTVTRTLHLSNPLMHGPDVLAVQQLLTAKGLPCAPDSWFGPETAWQCVEAKRRLGYVKAKQIPTCGHALVTALEEHAPWPPPLPTPASQRSRYVQAWRDAIAEHERWDYSQVRPIPHAPQAGRIVTDCSGAVTYLAQLVGLPDPNGRRFDGEGFTGTLLDHCRQITRAMLQPADLIVFGAYPGHHVAAVLTTGADPELGSHGGPGDPRVVALSAEAAGQAANGHTAVTYLRFLA